VKFTKLSFHFYERLIKPKKSCANCTYGYSPAKKSRTKIILRFLVSDSSSHK